MPECDDVIKCRAKSASMRPVRQCTHYSGELHPVDLVIIVATDREEHAIQKYLLPACNADGYNERWYKVYPPSGLGRIATDSDWLGCTLNSPDGARSVRVAMRRTCQQGMAAAASLATKACFFFRPRMIAMAGITAGRKGETNLGDIIVPTHITDYGAGKQDPDTFRPSSEPVRLPPGVEDECRSIKKDETLLSEIGRRWEGGDRPRPRVHLAPTVTGAAVVNDPDVWHKVLQPNRQIIGIEMEAYAFVLASTRAYPPPSRILVAKSVCDFAEHKVDDAQAYAAYTSARFLRAYVETYLLKIVRNKLTQSP